MYYILKTQFINKMNNPLLGSPRNNYQFFYTVGGSVIFSLVLLLVITIYSAITIGDINLLITDMNQVINGMNELNYGSVTSTIQSHTIDSEDVNMRSVNGIEIGNTVTGNDMPNDITVDNISGNVVTLSAQISTQLSGNLSFTNNNEYYARVIDTNNIILYNDSVLSSSSLVNTAQFTNYVDGGEINRHVYIQRSSDFYRLSGNDFIYSSRGNIYSFMQW